MNETMKLGLVTRGFEIRADQIDEEKRTLNLTFSSETPFERYWGIEILSHDAKHVDMAWIQSGNAPLLVGHNHDDQIGVVEEAWLQEGVGHARVRFGKSSRADEIFQDVRDGIRKNVSVGYYVKEMKLQETSEGGQDTYLITRWVPWEASIVAVPADPTVGVRSAKDELETIIVRDAVTAAPTAKGKKAMKTEDEELQVDVKAEEKEPEKSVSTGDIRARERRRQADILAIGRMAGMSAAAEKAVATEITVEDFRAKAFDHMIEKQAKPAVDMSALSAGDKRDLSRYSFLKAISEAATGLTGFEREMHEEARKQLRDSGVTVQGQMAIPYQVLAHRDLTVYPDASGGYTVATNLLAGSFIELLQNRMLVRQMGATVLDNLVGDIAIPGQATGATAAWEGENDENAESNPTFRQVALKPNRIGTFVDISKKLLVQSSVSVELIVRMLIADSIALGIDLSALHGTGSGDQPLGIAGTTGIGSVAGGTDGLAPAWSHIVELETAVAAANADVGRMGYLTNAKVRGKLKTVEKAAGTAQFVWTDLMTEPGWGMLNGYRAGVSNQVASNLSKGSAVGVCSALFFGNWADLLLAFWGGLDVVVDPFTLATTNLTRITANAYADVGVRHAASFSAMLDAKTT